MASLSHYFDHGREFPRDYTHVDSVAQIVQRALDVHAEAVRDRVFYGGAVFNS